MPSLSIIVPVYNQEKYLSKCLESITGQTIRDFEIIMVNDGSADTSASICETWARYDPRIKVLSKSHAGVEAAVVDGIAIATGKYIGFVDADDWILPDMFEVLMENICRTGADLVQCGVLVDGEHIAPEFNIDNDRLIEDAEKILTSYYTQNASLYPLTNARWNKLFRKDYLSQIIPLLNSSLSIGEDLYMNLLYLPYCKTVTIIKQPLYCYRVHEDSLSRRYSEKKRDAVLRMFDKIQALARDQNQPVSALKEERQKMLASLILDSLVSDLRSSNKRKHVQYLYNILEDKSQLSKLAKTQPFFGKVVLWFVRRHCFIPPILGVKVFLRLKRGKNE